MPAPANADHMIDTGKVIATTRKAFPLFYATAPSKDGALLDALALARAALLLGMGTPRDPNGGEAQALLEKATDAIERRFTELRERVRRSTTFQLLARDEQTQIESALFKLEAE